MAGRSVRLIRGRHQWEFSCGAGQELELLAFAAERATGPRGPLTLLDIAIVCKELTGKLGVGLNPSSEGADNA